MLSSISPMVECYQLDLPQTYHPIIEEIYAAPITQEEIDLVTGYDDYDSMKAGKLESPRLPSNPHYMEGWSRNLRGEYADWEAYCRE